MQSRLRHVLNQWFAGGLLFLSILVPRVLGDVQFTIPQPGQSYAATAPLAITWQDNGNAPTFADLSTATLKLCGNTDPTNFNCFSFLFQAASLSGFGGTYTANFPITLGANGQYFLQMTSILTAGGYVINYSDRFNLTGMTGTTEYVYVANTAGPARYYAPSAPSASNAFTVSYQDQAGWPTKYAPMQTQPGTTVTASTASRQYPTSAISAIFTTNTLQPYAVTTTTNPWNYPWTSVINDVSPQPDPSANGGSYPAKKKQKKKRWDD
ncbi:cell wall synthesis protein KRE9/KNH1-domain-containing protein [Lipomyces kononenkoae]|uniref:Cell wall synthesis protein KRE9/KNH1-domain-containing protein n=1 Tax=Lipomyces kononenkoae TaxID=34357 RepID=A0ACC3TCD9_LIPKO